MSIRTLTRPMKVAGTLTLTGLALYAMTRARSSCSGGARESNPAAVFSQWGPKSLRVRSVDTVNHNTKRLVFEFPDARASSGLSLTCMFSPSYIALLLVGRYIYVVADLDIAF